MKRIKSLIKNTKKYLIRITSPFRRKKLTNTDFSIISNNCWAGTIYRYFGLPYSSPTVGLYIWSDDYLRFISNLKHYLSTEIVFIDVSESKYKDTLYARKQEKKLLGRIDDVEIVFLHYKSREEAVEKWQRRCQRVNYNNLIYKFSNQNLCSQKNIEDFCEINAKKKIFFNNTSIDNINCVYVKGFEQKEDLVDDISTSMKYYDIYSLINEGIVEKR